MKSNANIKEMLPVMELVLGQLKRYRLQEKMQKDPLAVVGMACRFPGGESTEDFWRTLVEENDTITEVPAERWDINKYYSPDPGAEGKTYTRHGAFINDVDLFDATFFGISPIEALAMDPQQRMLLELSWRAFEHAGYLPQFEQETGVFVGVSYAEYATILRSSTTDARSLPYYSTGNMLNAIPGRLAYVFGFNGPCMAIDTACSSSLVALHLACNSIRNGECRQAVVGGVNLQLCPDNTIAVSQSKMLSRDGRCKTFDASANGYVRGEGCGVIIIKRLSDAINNEDRICAVIRGTAINQDGTGSGFTVPNGKAQQKLIRQALSNANAEPANIDYVEAHGTGTTLGDPIELAALHATYGAATGRQQSLWVGSVKTNIGHLEAAAGIAGVIKTILALQHKTIPAHLHFHEPNPHVPWASYNISVPKEKQSWPDHNRLGLAAVSSFGFSGVNAHVILEEAPLDSRKNALLQEISSYQLFTLSAKSSAALLEHTSKYIEFLDKNPSCSLSVLGKTVQSINPSFPYRIACVADSISSLRKQLGKIVTGKEDHQWNLKSQEPASIIWMFTGQGSQYPGMYRNLYNTQPVFRETVEHFRAPILETAGFDLLEVIGLNENSSETDLLKQTRFQQPCLFVMQYAMAKLLETFGIHPDYVIGHSLGEYVAACVACVMNAEDALRLVIARGALMEQVPEGSGMLAITSANFAEIKNYVDDCKHEVSIAAINSPSQIVLSGRLSFLQSIVKHLSQKNIPNKFLEVSQPFHSPLLKNILEPFKAVLHSVQLQEPSIPVISNLLGREVRKEIMHYEYWLEHMMNTVLFRNGIVHLSEKPGKKLWIELGPQPVLLSFVQNTFSKNNVEDLLPCVRKNEHNRKTLVQLIGSLYKTGIEINWKTFYANIPPGRIENLPGYPFQRKSYWPVKNGNTQQINSELNSDKATESFNKEEVLKYLQSSASFNNPGKDVLTEIVDKIDTYLKNLKESNEGLPVFGINLEPVEIVKETTALPHESRGVWIVLRDLLHDQKTFTLLSTALKEKGIEITTLIEGNSPLYTNGDHIYYWSSKDTNAWKNIFEDIELSFYNHIEGIIDLRAAENLDENEYEYSDANAIRLLHVAKQLSNCKTASRLKVILCSSQKQVIDARVKGISNITQHVADAMCTVLSKELPQQDFVHIDLPAVIEEGDLENVLACMLDSQTTHQFILRDGKCFTPSIKDANQNLAPVNPPTTTHFQEDAIYLITGASGAIGVELIDWMIGNGARHFVLVSRRGFYTAELQAKLHSFERRGAIVHEFKADLANQNDALKLEAYLKDSTPQLKGVFHVAGITDDDFLYRQDEERFRKVLQTKAKAAWSLHKMTRSFSLDYFIAFSSTASYMGLPGQGAYAAANAFLNGLMEYRKSLQLPALSICWGPWQIGMAARMPDSYWNLLKENGVYPLAAAKAFHVLGQLLLKQQSAIYLAAEVDADLLKNLNKTNAAQPSLKENKENRHKSALTQLENREAAVEYLEHYLKTVIEKIAGIAAEGDH